MFKKVRTSTLLIFDQSLADDFVKKDSRGSPDIKAFYLAQHRQSQQGITFFLMFGLRPEPSEPRTMATGRV